MKIVIKIGSNVLMGNKNSLDLELLKNIISELCAMKKDGYDVLIVTSGAVAVGMYVSDSSSSTSAACGQAILMKQYFDLFERQDIKIAQILLVLDDFKNREKYEHLKQTLKKLLDNKIIPIINENDVMSITESFGDNDSLASIIAVITEADKLIFLTNLDGLYSSDPKIDKTADIVKEVENIDLQIQKMCSKGISSSGTGGMLSKLKGAKLATTCGIETYIINGLVRNNLTKLLIENRKIGTKFQAKDGGLSERKKWLLIGTASDGKIIVDRGAREALENKKSLLAVGIRGINGQFKKQDFVSIVDNRGEVFAFGISNYNSDELVALRTLRNKETIKQKYPKVVVHIDNLTLLK